MMSIVDFGWDSRSNTFTGYEVKNRQTQWGQYPSSLAHFQDGCLRGSFQTAYSHGPASGLLFFQRYEVPGLISDRYSSQAIPIKISLATQVFKDSRLVALFPENFLSPTPESLEHPVLYVIDRFVERFFSTTCRILASPWVDSCSFDALRSVSADDITKCAVLWTHLHEHFHHTGPRTFSSYGAIATSYLSEPQIDQIDGGAGRTPCGCSGDQRSNPRTDGSSGY